MATQVKKQKEDNGFTFVIMPYSGHYERYFVDVYKPAIEDAGLRPILAKDIFRAGSIISDIWDLTKECKLVLAELTGKNANVFYELGLAHAITKPSVLLSESVDFIPFDLAGLRTIIYEKNMPNWGELLRAGITQAIRETLASPERSIPPTFLDTTSVKKKEVSPFEKDILELKNDVESLRRRLNSNTPYLNKSEIPVLDPQDQSSFYIHMAKRLRSKKMTDAEIVQHLLNQYASLTPGAATAIVEQSKKKRTLFDD